jgi:CRP-like cAMP-binding protein
VPDVHDLSRITASGHPVLGSTRPTPQLCRETRVSRISVLSADPELAESVPAADRPRALRAVWSTAVSFPAGTVQSTTVPGSPTTFALLVVKGVLTRQTSLSDRAMIELLLTGDVLPPWPASAASPRTETRLTALGQVQLALLDHRFVKAAAVWPGLMIALQRRVTDLQHRLAIHGVICQLPRVEQRVLAVLWLLAARTGTVTAAGTELPLTLTHDSLAQLTGSRRPTVSLAVKRLRAQGYLDRHASGVWLLPSAPATHVFEDLVANLDEV